MSLKYKLLHLNSTTTMNWLRHFVVTSKYRFCIYNTTLYSIHFVVFFFIFLCITDKYLFRVFLYLAVACICLVFFMYKWQMCVSYF